MRVLKVKIVSASGNYSWYSDKIGKEFYISADLPDCPANEAYGKVQFSNIITINNLYIRVQDFVVLYECDVNLVPEESNIVKQKLKKYKVLYSDHHEYEVSNDYYATKREFTQWNPGLKFINLIEDSIKEF